MPEQSLVPVGIMPRWLWTEIRVQALEDSIQRYLDANIDPLPEGQREINDNKSYLNNRNETKGLRTTH